MANGLREIDAILELLIDGEWHRIEDLSLMLDMPGDRLRSTLSFLAEHGFVQRRTHDGSVKIESELKSLMESGVSA